jgi:hypothetical protein
MITQPPEEAIMHPEQKETLPLPEAVTHLLEECRMVLPGLQALLTDGVSL